MRKRSVGVTIVGLLFVLVGLGGMLIVLGAIQGLYLLITGIGVLMLKNWARFMALTGALSAIALTIVFAAIDLHLKRFMNWPVRVESLVLDGLSI